MTRTPTSNRHASTKTRKGATKKKEELNVSQETSSSEEIEFDFSDGSLSEGDILLLEELGKPIAVPLKVFTKASSEETEEETEGDFSEERSLSEGDIKVLEELGKPKGKSLLRLRNEDIQFEETNKQQSKSIISSCQSKVGKPLLGFAGAVVGGIGAIPNGELTKSGMQLVIDAIEKALKERNITFDSKFKSFLLEDARQSGLWANVILAALNGKIAFEKIFKLQEWWLEKKENRRILSLYSFAVVSGIATGFFNFLLPFFKDSENSVIFKILVGVAGFVGNAAININSANSTMTDLIDFLNPKIGVAKRGLYQLNEKMFSVNRNQFLFIFNRIVPQKHKKQSFNAAIEFYEKLTLASKTRFMGKFALALGVFPESKCTDYTMRALKSTLYNLSFYMAFVNLPFTVNKTTKIFRDYLGETSANAMGWFFGIPTGITKWLLYGYGATHVLRFIMTIPERIKWFFSQPWYRQVLYLVSNVVLYQTGLFSGGSLGYLSLTEMPPVIGRGVLLILWTVGDWLWGTAVNFTALERIAVLVTEVLGRLFEKCCSNVQRNKHHYLVSALLAVLNSSYAKGEVEDALEGMTVLSKEEREEVKKAANDIKIKIAKEKDKHSNPSFSKWVGSFFHSQNRGGHFNGDTERGQPFQDLIAYNNSSSSDEENPSSNNSKRFFSSEETPLLRESKKSDSLENSIRNPFACRGMCVIS